MSKYIDKYKRVRLVSEDGDIDEALRSVKKTFAAAADETGAVILTAIPGRVHRDVYFFRIQGRMSKVQKQIIGWCIV